MSQDSGGEKTHPASGQKLQRVREEGNVPKSQDFASAAALSAALAAMYFFGKTTVEILIEVNRYYLGNADVLTFEYVPPQTLLFRTMYHMALCVVPFMIVMVVTGVVVNFLQVGALLTGKPLQPKLSRINPISGAQKFVSLRTLVELGKSIAKLVVVTAIVWVYLQSRFQEMLHLMQLDPLTLLFPVAEMVFGVWWRVVMAMIVIGVVDFAYQRWQHAQDQRMTQQEVKQESKELEGDPQIKRRVRQLQRQMVAQRMMGEVPEADVVITNPTHYAVALKYNAGNMTSPVVVAKGQRLIAQRIRELAVQHDVPIVQRPDLARTLHRTVEVGESIPESLFRTVAEVLSFVYRIDQRASKRKERASSFNNNAAAA